MNHKEKAKELVDKYIEHAEAFEPQLYEMEYSEQLLLSNAKACAIICVDEIIHIVPSIYVTNDEEIHSGHRQFWEKVKEEIQKLP